MAKISVIIPIYNSEKYLNKCFDSILNQTFSDFEIVAVNDGSTDGSQRIVDSYIEKFPDKIRCFYQENAGQSAARNKGLDIATGEYVAFVDSDDYIALNAFEKAYSCAEENNADIVCFGMFLDKNGDITKYNYCKFNDLSEELKYILHEASPCNKLVRRCLFADNALKFTEGIIYEDFELIPQLLLFTKKIKYIEDELYYYVIHNNSTMRQSNYNPKLKSIFSVMETLNKKFLDTEYQSELEYLFITHLLHDATFRFLQFEEGREDVTKISQIIKDYFPLWRRNQYFNECSLRYRIFCELAYRNMFDLLRLLFRIK